MKTIVNSSDVQEYQCPVSAAMRVIGGKWKPVILWLLYQDTQRFGALNRMIPDITQKMLTRHLRELESDGIVHREVYAVVPPKVEYSLTEKGHALKPVLLALAAWGKPRYCREPTGLQFSTQSL